MKRQVDAIQWGGGGSRIFPWPPKAGAIQWGGGGSTMNFPLMEPFYICRLSPPPESAPELYTVA